MNPFAQLLTVRPDLANRQPIIVGKRTIVSGYNHVLQFGDELLAFDGNPVVFYLPFNEPELFEETLKQLGEVPEDDYPASPSA